MPLACEGFLGANSGLLLALFLGLSLASFFLIRWWHNWIQAPRHNMMLKEWGVLI